jgi:hypothetical protein
MFLNNHKYSEITNIYKQIEKQELGKPHSSEVPIQDIKTHMYYIKHTIQIFKRYRKKLEYFSMYNLLKIAIVTCLQAITRQTKQVIVTISICSHSIGFF